MIHRCSSGRRVLLIGLSSSATRRRCLSGGSFSRMLDMGGMPGASNTKVRPINASKNNQLQVVAFDFDLLTRTTTPPSSSQEDGTSSMRTQESNASKEEPSTSSSTILPSVGMVQDVAKLLNVQLGGEGSSHHRQRHNDDQDDLSVLTGEAHHSSSGQATPTQLPSKSTPIPHTIVGATDIRSKYADRLRNRLDGGIATVEHVKQDLASGGGDADGHLAARNIAIQQGTQQTKWMALTGTGALIQYLSNRSMKLCLLPTASTDHNAEQKRMREFETQLPNIRIDMVAKFPDSTDADIERKQQQRRLKGLIQTVMKKFEIVDPKYAMVVSDRDDYLRAAKDLGWVVCRYRANSTSRRGNVSEHYLVRSIPEVQDVVDEINGISFNALRQ